MSKNNFLPIPDAPGYEINNKGEVRNIRTGKILEPYKHKDRPTPIIHIPKYHIRRTAKSLRRQAVAAHIEKNRKTSWLPIPSAGEKYEININGLVRNSKTKKILKSRLCNGCKCVMLSVNGKSVDRGINSLLWEVHGKIFEKQHPRTCAIKIIKDKEHHRFKLQKDCVIFLCNREGYQKDYVRKKLGNRVENFCGWQIFYTESD